MSGDFETRTGEGFDGLIEALAGVLSDGTELHEPKDIVCVALAVVADFGRLNFGDDCLERLSELVRRRHNFAMIVTVEGLN